GAARVAGCRLAHPFRRSPRPGDPLTLWRRGSSSNPELLRQVDHLVEPRQVDILQSDEEESPEADERPDDAGRIVGAGYPARRQLQAEQLAEGDVHHAVADVLAEPYPCIERRRVADRVGTRVVSQHLASLEHYRELGDRNASPELVEHSAVTREHVQVTPH